MNWIPPFGIPVDLRSDTVTKPTQSMYKAMVDAPLGDDVLGDDPTVIRLQERVAELLGKESALFMPSGTMTNQTAIKVHTRPGDAVICDEGCHILNFEGGAPAAISGVVLRTIAGKNGAFTAQQVREKHLSSENSHLPRTSLVEIENSHNRAGGAIFPQNDVVEISKVCNELCMSLHLDGARLWNVFVATGIPLNELAGPADTVSVCFSKGLGCPIGSVLAGDRERMKYAHRIRKYMGGGMRQSGMLAGAALFALDNHVERLTEDHEKARLLSNAFAEFPGVYPIKPDTNIVIVEFDRSIINPEHVRSALDQRGVRFLTISETRVRLVTHLDITDEGVSYAVMAIKDVLGG